MCIWARLRFWRFSQRAARKYSDKPAHLMAQSMDEGEGSDLTFKPKTVNYYGSAVAQW